VLFVRGPDEPDADADLAGRCALLEGFSRQHGTGLSRELSNARVRLSAVIGRPTWAGRWRVPALQRRLDELIAAWRPDIVQAEYHVMGQYALSLDAGSPPFVLTQYESGTMAVRERLGSARGAARLIGWLSVRAWNRFERSVMARADAVVVLTERDAAEAWEMGARRVERIPLGLRTRDRFTEQRPESVRGEPESKEIVFVGNFGHPPNVDAAQWLVREIFPRVRARHAAARLRLVGAEVPASVLALAGDGVEVFANVPDVTPFLERASVVVAPLRMGSGMRVKVLEALAAGKALVATPLAVEGLALADNEQAVIAEDTAALARAVDELLDDSERRKTLGLAARQWARDHLDWSRVVGEYDSLYRELLAPAVRGDR
jgi:glycosyltransferase involved in cell wall biosynthesis